MPGANGRPLARDAFDAWASPRRPVRRKPAGDHRQDPLGTRTPRPRPLPRPDRTRRTSLRRDRPLHRTARHRDPAGPTARDGGRRARPAVTVDPADS
jgi:hypothetical protein